MKIAFVGKGGSGKTTLAGLFALHAAQRGISVLAVDADLNMHLGELLGFAPPPSEKHISYPAAAREIVTVLKGTNPLIKDAAHFKKTTPPGEGSHIIHLDNGGDPILSAYAPARGPLRLMTVGTYSEDGIGTSCYHNNLAILENVLSHTKDGPESIVAADMVAGIDAFAGSLHAQFDLLTLVVEPTRRSLEVYEQYRALAEEAGVADSLAVVGNKIASREDEAFLRGHIPAEALIGSLARSEYLLSKEREGGAFDISKLEEANRAVLEHIEKRLKDSAVDPDARLRQLHSLHARYVRQASITERFGDLTGQIDPNFSYNRMET